MGSKQHCFDPSNHERLKSKWQLPFLSLLSQMGSTELTVPSEYEGRLWSLWTRLESLRPDRVEVMLSINMIACEHVLNNSCVFPGTFDGKTYFLFFIIFVFY